MKFFGKQFSLDLLRVQRAVSSETRSEGTANITVFPVVGECLIGAPWALAPEPGQNCKTVLESPELISLIRCDFHVDFGGLCNQPIDSFRYESVRRVPWKDTKLSSVDQMNMNMNLLSEGVARQVRRSSCFLFSPSVLMFVVACEFCSLFLEIF